MGPPSWNEENPGVYVLVPLLLSPTAEIQQGNRSLLGLSLRARRTSPPSRRAQVLTNRRRGDGRDAAKRSAISVANGHPRHDFSLSFLTASMQI